MSRKIKVYGQLAEYIGHKELDVNCDVVKNPASAVRFLLSNFVGVEKHISNNNYEVKVGDYSITKDEFLFPVGDADIHFIPVIEGAGGGVGRILAGVALIGLAFATGGASIGAGGLLKGGITFKASALGGAFVSKALVYGGGLLALSGASQLLSPIPEQPDFQSAEDPRISFNFSGIQNVTRAGTPINLVFGELFVGSIVISAQIDTEQVQA